MCGWPFHLSVGNTHHFVFEDKFDFEAYDPWRRRHEWGFCVCVVGVPDCHRGSPQAGSAGTRAHVCTGARWSLFHLIRGPHARGLWVWLHCQVRPKSKHWKINCSIYLSRIPTGERTGCSKVMVWRLCGVTRPLSPCLNLYVTQESTWDTSHAWKVFSFFLHSPLNLSSLPPTSPFCFPSLFSAPTDSNLTLFFFCLFSKKTLENFFFFFELSLLSFFHPAKYSSCMTF